MKKLWLVLALLLIGTFAFAGGQIPDPWNISVDRATWTAVTASQSAVKFQVRTRNRNPFKISAQSTGNSYYTATTDATVVFDINIANGTTLFYVQMIDSSDTLEILVLR